MPVFSLPGGMGVEELRAALAGEFTLAAGRPATAERTYYDTFDGRLFAKGLSLYRDGDREVLCDAEGTPAPPEALAAAVGVRALAPVATVRVSTRELRVLDELDKTVTRLTLEAPAGLQRRLHVVPVRGYDAECARVTALLGLQPCDRRLAAEAVLAAGGRPEGVSSKPRVPLTPGEPAGLAAARICRRLAGVIADNLPGTLADTDTEFLHDLRVAVRRTRAVQRELRGVFASDLPHFREEFRWLQAVTGPTRDLDVYLLDLPDIGPLHDLLARRRAAEQRRMARALQSARARRALADWGAALDALEAGTASGPDAGTPVEDVVRGRIARVHRRMLRDGRRIDAESPADALHELRKQGKELRYLLELFGSLFDRAQIRPLVAALKDLQDTLGRHQDHEVQADWLISVAGEINDPAAVLEMGRAVDRLERAQAQARAEFAERFAAFAAIGKAV